MLFWCRDIEFDFLEDKEYCLHGLDAIDKFFPTDALRVTELFDDPQFFVDGATASDISQSDMLGDCWFLSGLGVVATAGLIEKICVEVRPSLPSVACSRLIGKDFNYSETSKSVYMDSYSGEMRAGWM